MNRVTTVQYPISGFDRSGAPLQIREGDVKTPAVLIGIPAKPLPWFQTFLQQVGQIEESEKVVVVVQFVEGLEGETIEK